MQENACRKGQVQIRQQAGPIISNKQPILSGRASSSLPIRALPVQTQLTHVLSTFCIGTKVVGKLHKLKLRQGNSCRS